MIKLSIVTSVLDSHEIVRRQLLHYNPLPNNVELIMIDDGSKPQLNGHIDNMKLLYSNNYNPWTEHIARNIGAKKAIGEYIFFIDIDYIIPYEAISKCLEFTGDRKPIRRQFGVLSEDGQIKKDSSDLKEWGLKDRWVRKRFFPGHRSQFLIRKSLFWDMGGYNESLDGKWRVTGGAGERFWRKWQKLESKGQAVEDKDPLDVYMFPCGKYCDNEVNIFHKLQK